MCGSRQSRHRATSERVHADPVAARADLRAGDAERDAVAQRLASHFAAGRLSEAEFEGRAARAARGATTGELAALESDLPPLRGDAPEGRRRPLRLPMPPCAVWHLAWIVPVAASMLP